MIKVGADPLAAVLYEDAVIESLRKGDVSGIFLNTFYKTRNGKKVYAKKTLQRILATNLLDEIVVHLAPFDNSHRYPIKQLRKEILADSAWLEAEQAKTRTLIIISPFCENNHKAKDMKPLFDDIARVAPRCDYINSIWKGEEVQGVDTEIHIPDARNLPRIPKNRFTISFDGFGGDGSQDFPDAKLIEILKPYILSGRLRHVRGWHFRCNGKKDHLDSTPIGLRRYLPNANYILCLVYTIEAAINPQAGIWPANKLLKTMSDDHGNDLNKSKDCRIMCILPDHTQSMIEVFDSAGNKIDTWRDLNLPPHTNTPKGKRLYSALYLNELANKAFKNTGSYLIRVGNNPSVDGRLRNGYFKR